MSFGPLQIKDFREADRKVDTFEALLRENSIEIRNGSQLEAAALVLRKLVDDSNRLRSDPTYALHWPEMESDLRLGLGTLHVMDLVVARRNHSNFRQLLPHLELLNQGQPSTISPSDSLDQAHNKLFELLVALMAMKDGRDLQLDDPKDSAGGHNPDVIVRHIDSQRWAFACKVISSASPMTLFERIEEGMEQIQRSPADVGIVTLSFKNRIPHEQFMPSIQDSSVPALGAIRDPKLLFQLATQHIRVRLKEMLDHVSREALSEVLELYPKALPGVLSPIVIAAVHSSDRGPIPVTIANSLVFDLSISGAPLFPNPPSGAVYEVLQAMSCGLEP